MEGFDAHESEGEVRFVVRVQPRASHNAIEGVRGGALLIRLTAPPVEGEANDALVRLLASRLNVSKSAVRILSGARGRLKRVTVRGVTSEQVRALAVNESRNEPTVGKTSDRGYPGGEDH